MAEPVEAGVLEVFNIDRSHLVDRRVALLPQAEQVGCKLLAISMMGEILYMRLPWQVFFKPEK